MTEITFKGEPIQVGILPAVGNVLDFSLTQRDLTEFHSKDIKADTVVLNIFPSLDTPTCAASVRKFNQLASEIGGVQILCISADLPFAQSRFCAAEGIENVTVLSSFRHPECAEEFGTLIKSGPLRGLHSRAILILREGVVTYRQQVLEVTDEPDYEEVLKFLEA